MIKTCLECHNSFTKPKKISNKQWVDDYSFCSKVCRQSNKALKEKLSLRVRGKNNPFFGKHHTVESKKKRLIALNKTMNSKKIWKKCLECNRLFTVQPSKLKLGKGKYCSKQCHVSSPIWKMKVANYHKGNNSHFWRGGKTTASKIIRSSLEYSLWRVAVFMRDNYTCVIGGRAHGSQLQADHIKSFALYPELRFAIDNGRTLCVDCHRKTDLGKKN